MEEPHYIVEMNHIYKSFSGVEALKDVSINLKKNEVVGIVGHNGAGKSTLIKCLCGMLRYSSGSILLKQKEINGLKTHQIISQSIAYVPQTNNVFSRLLGTGFRLMVSQNDVPVEEKAFQQNS